jgi:hypothetical protein
MYIASVLMYILLIDVCMYMLYDTSRVAVHIVVWILHADNAAVAVLQYSTALWCTASIKSLLQQLSCSITSMQCCMQCSTLLTLRVQLLTHSLHYALYTMRCTLCGVHYALYTMLYTLCCIHYDENKQEVAIHGCSYTDRSALYARRAGAGRFD